MTYYKTLAKTDNGNVIASEVWEKFAKAPHYTITTTDKYGIAHEIRTARTTWKRKFNELARG